MAWYLGRVRSALALLALLAAACGGPSLSCPSGPTLPDPDPAYTDRLASLVVVPSRARLRSASEAELEAFTGLATELQVACEASPPGPACAMPDLRARLTALPAPDHPALFTDIDGALDASIAHAHGEVATGDRDCDGQTEAVCDARAVAKAFARAACELGAGHG